MAIHSSILAWKIPWTEEPGGLQSMESQSRTWLSESATTTATLLLSSQLNSRWVQFSSVAQSCPTLWNPMDCSTPFFPVHHQLPELAQTHVHWVGDAIQPSHPLLSPSPPAFNLFQHQGDAFHWVTSLHQVAKVLQLQHQSFQWIFRTDFLPDGLGLILQSNGLSRVFSNTTVQKHQFSGTQLSLWSNSHIHTWILEKP